MIIRLLHGLTLCITLLCANMVAVCKANASEYWQGESKCDTLFEIPLTVLPGGSYLKDLSKDSATQAHYRLANGSTLKLTVQAVEKVPISGSDFRTVYRNLFKSKPLQDPLSRTVDDHTTLAEVNMLYNLDMYVEQVTGEPYVIAKPDGLTLSIDASIRIADWSEYAQASAESQKAWDRHKCVSYHHELGHILIAAQMFEESQDGWFDLKAVTVEEFDRKQKELFATLTKKINERHDAYHKAIEDMEPALSESRPYLELPFPWLEGTIRQGYMPTR